MGKIMTIILIILAVISYAIKEVLIFKRNNSVFTKSKWDSFFGVSSWIRKYEVKNDKYSTLVKAPNNWYYRKFNIKFKEKFPGSATIFVFLTDAMHFFQFLFFNFLTLGIVLCIGFTGMDILINFVALRLLIWLIWGLFFEYLLLRRR